MQKQALLSGGSNSTLLYQDIVEEQGLLGQEKHMKLVLMQKTELNPLLHEWLLYQDVVWPHSSLQSHSHILTPTHFGHKHRSELSYSFLLYPCEELFILKLLIALTQMPF